MKFLEAVKNHHSTFRRTKPESQRGQAAAHIAARKPKGGAADWPHWPQQQQAGAAGRLFSKPERESPPQTGFLLLSRSCCYTRKTRQDKTMHLGCHSFKERKEGGDLVRSKGVSSRSVAGSNNCCCCSAPPLLSTQQVVGLRTGQSFSCSQLRCLIFFQEKKTRS